MLEILKEHFFVCLFNNIVVIYIISKILKEKIILSKLRTYLILVLMNLLIIFNSLIVPIYIRFLTATVIISLFANKIFANKGYRNVLFASVIEQIIMFFSEIIFAIIKILFFKNNVSFFEKLPGSAISVCIICFIAIFLINLIIKGNINKIILKIKVDFDKTKDYIAIIIFLITLNIVLLILYKYVYNYFIFIINIFFILYYTFVMYKSLKESQENKILISNLNEYEKMLDYQRVNNHENKNQLLVIKSMIEKKDKKLMEYINEIIKEKREDSEIIYNKAKRIPSGGLQGLIYQKMLLMQEKNIEVNLDINSKVRKVDLENLSSKMNYDICRIVGIIIDNAIEETAKFNKKDREIIISMYIDDMFIIEVSNRIKDDMDLSKIYEKGYTNKEKGHGYGLSLLKKIVNENDNIINEVKIVNNIFTQIIKIKM